MPISNEVTNQPTAVSELLIAMGPKLGYFLKG